MKSEKNHKKRKSTPRKDLRQKEGLTKLPERRPGHPGGRCPHFKAPQKVLGSPDDPSAGETRCAFPAARTPQCGCCGATGKGVSSSLVLRMGCWLEPTSSLPEPSTTGTGILSV